MSQSSEPSERIPVSIDQHSFSSVMHETAPCLKTTVALSSASNGNTQKAEKPPELALEPCFRAMG